MKTYLISCVAVYIINTNMKILTSKQLQSVQYLVLILGILGPVLINIIFHYPKWTIWFQVSVLLVGGSYVFYQLKMQGKEVELKQRLIRGSLLVLFAVIGLTIFDKYYSKPLVKDLMKQHSNK